VRTIEAFIWIIFVWFTQSGKEKNTINAFSKGRLFLYNGQESHYGGPNIAVHHLPFLFRIIDVMGSILYPVGDYRDWLFLFLFNKWKVISYTVALFRIFFSPSWKPSSNVRSSWDSVIK
jgi:hypothetical protein